MSYLRTYTYYDFTCDRLEVLPIDTHFMYVRMYRYVVYVLYNFIVLQAIPLFFMHIEGMLKSMAFGAHQEKGLVCYRAAMNTSFKAPDIHMS